ncbi:hypothetical protein KJZ61_02810 [Candidatus Dependentiae bacterium]|nr:hypothetical protein [Candidatus Dependentiae bacterium]
MIPKGKLLSFLFGCLVLAGCAGRKISKKHVQSQPEKAGFALFKAFHDQESLATDNPDDDVISRVLSSPSQKEARLVDVPMPLRSVLHDPESDDGSLVFTTPLNRDELIVFYRREMERLGWVEQICFLQGNQIFIFKKPDRWLAVSLHSAESSFWRREENTKVVIQQANTSIT